MLVILVALTVGDTVLIAVLMYHYTDTFALFVNQGTALVYGLVSIPIVLMLRRRARRKEEKEAAEGANNSRGGSSLDCESGEACGSHQASIVTHLSINDFTRHFVSLSLLCPPFSKKKSRRSSGKAQRPLVLVAGDWGDERHGKFLLRHRSTSHTW